MIQKFALLLALSSTLLLASPSQVEKVLNNYMSAWAEHNVTKIESFYDDKVIWYDLASDSTTKTKAVVATAITDAFLNSVKDMYWVRSGDVFVSGNTITYEWTYGGTYNGMFGESKIVNKTFSLKGISTTTINEKGKIIAQKDYYDLYALMHQLVK